jgi:DNA-binding transcriptional ArsR family regulator
MDVDTRADSGVATVAGAIGEPGCTRMLDCLMEGRARTSTELAIMGGVVPSAADAHLERLQTQGLVRVFVQGRDRYQSLARPAVARALESLSVLVGGSRSVPSPPEPLRAARSCCDHMAGALAVSLYDRLIGLRWIHPATQGNGFEITREGEKALRALGVEVEAARRQRRRLAYACLDWSERRLHLGGALGPWLLKTALARGRVAGEFESRALRVTTLGRRELQARLESEVPDSCRDPRNRQRAAVQPRCFQATATDRFDSVGSSPIRSRFTPVVSIRKAHVTTAPSTKATTNP